MNNAISMTSGKRVYFSGTSMTARQAVDHLAILNNRINALTQEAEAVKTALRSLATNVAPSETLRITTPTNQCTIGVPETRTALKSDPESVDEALTAVICRGGISEVTLTSSGIAMLTDDERTRLTVTTVGKRRVSIR